MKMTFENYLQAKLPDIRFTSAKAVLDLVVEGGTVPFIARYRKEKTGNLDEVQIRSVIELNETYEETGKRQEFILKEIETQGNLTAELKERILKSFDLGELEEIYRPFKKKRKTKATVAREAGIEPLANWIWDLGQGKVKDATSLEVKAKEFQNVPANFVTYEQVLKGAQDIVVERLTNNAELREKAKNDLWDNGQLISNKTKEFKANSKYSMYAEFKEPIKNLISPKASHRYLAVRRGWQESELSINLEGNTDQVIHEYEKVAFSVENTQATPFLKQAAKMAYTVYVQPSISNEIHKVLKDTADDHAITVFAENVKKLLMASPYGAKTVLGVDPGLRTGCKVALVDKGGHLLSHTVVHTLGDTAKETAKKMLTELTSKIQIEAIAVGNGTAGRETEIFFKSVLKEIKKEVPVVLVNESGASVYSASDVAREEFPDLDLTVRGAVSIARRLQDPLAELVKIDPKSIGVGQYQHDVLQTKLKKNLDHVVESCVNQVGVDLNTASHSLLAYVAGVGPALAKNILEYRKTNGLFQDRDSLLKVSRFSNKIYEQAAGFLRLPNSKNALDKTGIHPESYAAVRDMSKELGISVIDLMNGNAKKLLELRTKWAKIVGEFTFDDIIKELEKPGRDPRGEFAPVAFRDDIFELKDVTAGMICPGVVTNVTNFGAFVDIGVHQDGLVHISVLSDKFVEDPKTVVSPGDHVQVKVIAVDQEKKQISLSMRMDEETQRTERPKREDTPKFKPSGRDPRKDFKANPKAGKKTGGHQGGKPAARKQAPLNNPFAALGDQLKGIKLK
ncbi:MAG: RNA-binding transcriptional accessory protein [Bdellovibrionales bacterium]|nr:RNA-binding transcriptional accessory protein [Bdellovibrionales bacterium]